MHGSATQEWRDIEHNANFVRSLTGLSICGKYDDTKSQSTKFKNWQLLEKETATLTVLNNLTANINKVIN
jgi:hypothetical protein